MTTTTCATKRVGSEPLAVDARQLGRMLGLSIRTVRTMDSAGRLPRPVKLNGSSVRWLVNEVRDWLAAGAPSRSEWEAMKDR